MTERAPRLPALFARAADALERKPRVGRLALNWVIPRILPVTRGLGLTVVALDDERAEIRLPFSRTARNHVGGVYLGVLLIVAEVTMAIYVMRLCRPDRFSTLVRSTTSSFVKQAKEPVRAICAPSHDVRAELDRCLALGVREKATLSVDVEVVFDRSGEAMGKVTFEISILRKA